VTVTAAGRRMVRDVASSESYLSAHDPRPSFGLGPASVADQVEVRWPDGTRTTLKGVPAGKILKVGRGGASPP